MVLPKTKIAEDGLVDGCTGQYNRRMFGAIGRKETNYMVAKLP